MTSVGLVANTGQVHVRVLNEYFVQHCSAAAAAAEYLYGAIKTKVTINSNSDTFQQQL